MDILYAFQGTGNGHVARAQEIIPILKKYAKVDTLISGHQSQLSADFPIDYKYKGISLLYNKSGGISYKKILLKNNFVETIKIINQIELSKYDLILNDFEPITAWACKLRGLKMLELSHQAALDFAEAPKPSKKSVSGEFFLKNYAPSEQKIGFHFENYHPKIKKPVIRKSIRQLTPSNDGFYIVYLPSFSDENLIKTLKQIPVQWKIFSKHAKNISHFENVSIFPIDTIEFLKNFARCEGILCNAGFEGPAEALFLNKKLFVVPIHNQYEQECNAFALQQLGIRSSKILDVLEITNWVASAQIFTVDYPDDIEEIITNEVLTF
ncbi:glycosyltransferase family protein [Frigoriflavimonas asaccharolytica]|uniref:Uncharacterized protein (TIGR00661 family) n=1 Tax=Frigoriflavimonas asaccharolytica TaxID=2735899 RepID=A0A8J8GCZ9_9FLAO|nr:glycosyltransferase family protein [Frigoriflavimonas asaccharolytica]NRS93487.1 uncharacterized protein (TIGR00661 family) [Frigoriflavimonas asaccharolytica]